MSHSTTPKLLISHKFGRAKVADLMTRGQTVFTDMSAAVLLYPSPPVPLPVLKQDIDNLTVSAAAAANGSKKDIAQRNKDRHALEEDLTLLGAYAVKVANGDAAILTLSGFVAAPPRAQSAPQRLTQPFVDSIDQGNSGELVIAVTPVAKAHSYDVRYSALVNGTPAAWITVTVTVAKKPITINGLTPGTTYAFQVRALGGAGYTDWSDSATRMSI